MKKALSLVLCLLLLLPCGLTLAEAVTPADADAYFENGCRARKNGLTIVDLHGTWHEMGRQYGYLLSEELRAVADLCGEIVSAGESNASAAEATLDIQRAQMPYTIRRFFAGMAETSGLSLYELECANSVERIAGLPRCSFAAAWDDYAPGGLVVGRNYDYGEIFKRLDKEVVIAVFHPADGAMAAATIGYAGEIYAVNGMNEAGVFLELNNGTFSARQKARDLRITGTTQLLTMLFEADSLGLLDAYFNSLLNSSSYIINAADENTVHSYEWCAAGSKRGDGYGEDGVFASTNHYLSPEWEFDAPDEAASVQTTLRRQNLLALLEAKKGSVDAEAMMKIIETRLEDGGAANDYTVYQLVAMPASRTIWLKTVSQTEWTEFSLAPFFAR